MVIRKGILMIALISKVLVHVNACPLSRAQGTGHPRAPVYTQAPPLQSSAPAQADAIPPVCDISTSNACVTHHQQVAQPTTPPAPCEPAAVKNKDNKTQPIARGGEGGFEMRVRGGSGRIPTRSVFDSRVNASKEVI